jgi:hypothetical protein
MLSGVRRYFKHSSLSLGILACVIAFFIGMCAVPNDASSRPPRNNTKSKFYDFNDQLIDGQIRKPTAIYTDARAKVKFDRLLRLKRSFMKELFDTSKERVFK